MNFTHYIIQKVGFNVLYGPKGGQHFPTSKAAREYAENLKKKGLKKNIDFHIHCVKTNSEQSHLLKLDIRKWYLKVMKFNDKDFSYLNNPYLKGIFLRGDLAFGCNYTYSKSNKAMLFDSLDKAKKFLEKLKGDVKYKNIKFSIVEKS